MTITEGYPDIVGKRFGVITDNPFIEFFCIIKEVRKNRNNEYWVRFEYTSDGSETTQPLNSFMLGWKEVK